MNSPLPGRSPMAFSHKSPVMATYDGGDFENGVMAKLARGSSVTLVVDEEMERREESTACVLFALVGIGYLFPFSALTQPVDYWKVLFPDYNIEFALTSTFMYTNLTFLALIVGLGGHPWFTGRIVGGFIGQLIVLTFVPTSYFFLTSENANAIAVLGSTAIVAIATAFLDSSTIGLVSHYPLRVQESFQLGVGLSTLIGSFYRDLTKLVFPVDQLVLSSLIYFYTGAVTIALCILAYFKLLRLRLTEKCLYETVDDHGMELTETSHLLEQQQSTGGAVVADQQLAQPTRFSVLRKVIWLEVMLTLTFVSSLALWPPLVTEIRSFNFPRLQATGWWSLILLTLFSVCDCVGRALVRYRGFTTPTNIHYLVLARFLMIPLIVGIVKEVFLTHDVFSVIAVGILGYTNGYLGTLCIIFINESVQGEEQIIAGAFTSFFLNSGLVIGASVGLFMEKLVLN